MVTGKYQFFYDQMPENHLRLFYTKALQAAQQRESTFVIPSHAAGKISFSNALLYMFGDHPELFDLNIGHLNTWRTLSNQWKIQLFYRESGESAAQREVNFCNAVEQILCECFPNGWQHLSPLMREKLIFNYIADHIAYDHEALQNSRTTPGWSSQSSDAWSAYGALVKKKAVCQGVACAFKLLCDQVDIPSLVVIGTVLSVNERHAWNMVRIDGHFYHVDCTWMLRTEINTQIPYRRYKYFNIPDQMFQGERTVEMDYLPKCRSLRHNPFFIRKLCVRNAGEATDLLAKQLKEGNSRFAILCVGFSMTKDECASIMTRVTSLTGKRVQWYLEEHFLGGYTV